MNQPVSLWQVVANAKDAVVGAREAVATTVTGAKETVAHTITGVMGKTKEAVQDSVEMTKSVVNGSINTVLGSRVVQMVSSGVDSALTKSETLVDQYLPLTEAELGKTNSRLLLWCVLFGLCFGGFCLGVFLFFVCCWNPCIGKKQAVIHLLLMWGESMYCPNCLLLCWL